MAEAIYHGKSSKAFWNTVEITQITGWTATLTRDMADATVMAAATTGKTRAAGFVSGTASVTCYLGGDNAIDEGAEAVLELLRDATDASKGYAGTAICTGVEDGADMNGVETVTYNFQFSGAVSATVTAGTP